MQRNLTYPHIPNEDCEATLIHPSTISLPNQVCEQSLLNLEHTYWIPLHLSNEWLYVAPKTEVYYIVWVYEIPVGITKSWKIIFATSI
jgi:hypothetical protein